MSETREFELNVDKQIAQGYLSSMIYFKGILYTMVQCIGKAPPHVKGFQHYQSVGKDEGGGKKAVIGALNLQPDFKQYFREEIMAAIAHYRNEVRYNPRGNQHQVASCVI